MPISYYILFFLLLYFIILSTGNSYCDETSNIVLDHVIVVHFCDGFTS